MTHRRVLHCALLALATLFFAALACPAAAEEGYDAGQATLGKNLYRSYCSSCHGLEARGDGSLAEVLTVPPGDLTQLAAENDGTFPTERTRKVIDGREKVRGHGTADMPAWGDAFQAVSASEEDVAAKIDQLVHYLKSIQN